MRYAKDFITHNEPRCLIKMAYNCYLSIKSHAVKSIQKIRKICFKGRF